MILNYVRENHTHASNSFARSSYWMDLTRMINFEDLFCCFHLSTLRDKPKDNKIRMLACPTFYATFFVFLFYSLIIVITYQYVTNFFHLENDTFLRFSVAFPMHEWLKGEYVALLWKTKVFIHILVSVITCRFYQIKFWTLRYNISLSSFCKFHDVVTVPVPGRQTK